MIAVLLLAGMAYSPLVTFGEQFPRNLRLGDRGADVRALQIALNRDPVTQVALSGPGSSGLETDYFGPLTYAAVVRFQEKYQTEVLAPLGLTKGTGFVGPATRGELVVAGGFLMNTGADSEIVHSRAESTSQGVLAAEERVSPTRPPSVTRVVPSAGPPGTRVTLHGIGFTPEGNDIRASFANLEDVSSPDGTTLSFTVESPFPSNLELPPTFDVFVNRLQYGFYVRNENGISNAVPFELTF